MSEKCPQCNIGAVHCFEDCEDIFVDIGDHRIKACAFIKYWQCDHCLYKKEMPGGRKVRNEVLKEAIDEFWNKVLNGFVDTVAVKLAKAKFAAALNKLGGKQRGKISEEFGRWLLNQHYE